MGRVTGPVCFALAMLADSADAQVSWEYDRDNAGCYAGAISYMENSRFQLVTEGDRVAGFIMSNDKNLDSLKTEQTISAKGVFSNGESVDLGTLMLVGRRPVEGGGSEPWAYLMFTEPNRTADKRMFNNQSLTIYASGIYLGTFTLTGAELAITSLLNCAME